MVTIGGIFGTITEIKDDRVRLRIADKVEIEMAKAGVDHVRGDGPRSEKGKGKPEDETGKGGDKTAENAAEGGQKDAQG